MNPLRRWRYRRLRRRAAKLRAVIRYAVPVDKWTKHARDAETVNERAIGEFFAWHHRDKLKELLK